MATAGRSGGRLRKVLSVAAADSCDGEAAAAALSTATALLVADPEAFAEADSKQLEAAIDRSLETAPGCLAAARFLDEWCTAAAAAAESGDEVLAAGVRSVLRVLAEALGPARDEAAAASCLATLHACLGGAKERGRLLLPGVLAALADATHPPSLRRIVGEAGLLEAVIDAAAEHAAGFAASAALRTPAVRFVANACRAAATAAFVPPVGLYAFVRRVLGAAEGGEREGGWLEASVLDKIDACNAAAACLGHAAACGAVPDPDSLLQLCQAVVPGEEGTETDVAAALAVAQLNAAKLHCCALLLAGHERLQGGDPDATFAALLGEPFARRVAAARSAAATATPDARFARERLVEALLGLLCALAQHAASACRLPENEAALELLEETMDRKRATTATAARCERRQKRRCLQAVRAAAGGWPAACDVFVRRGWVRRAFDSAAAVGADAGLACVAALVRFSATGRCCVAAEGAVPLHAALTGEEAAAVRRLCCEVVAACAQEFVEHDAGLDVPQERRQAAEQLAALAGAALGCVECADDAAVTDALATLCRVSAVRRRLLCTDAGSVLAACAVRRRAGTLWGCLRMAAVLAASKGEVEEELLGQVAGPLVRWVDHDGGGVSDGDLALYLSFIGAAADAGFLTHASAAPPTPPPLRFLCGRDGVGVSAAARGNLEGVLRTLLSLTQTGRLCNHVSSGELLGACAEGLGGAAALADAAVCLASLGDEAVGTFAQGGGLRAATAALTDDERRGPALRILAECCDFGENWDEAPFVGTDAAEAVVAAMALDELSLCFSSVPALRRGSVEAAGDAWTAACTLCAYSGSFLAAHLAQVCVAPLAAFLSCTASPEACPPGFFAMLGELLHSPHAAAYLESNHPELVPMLLARLSETDGAPLLTPFTLALAYLGFNCVATGVYRRACADSALDRTLRAVLARCVEECPSPSSSESDTTASPRAEGEAHAVRWGRVRKNTAFTALGMMRTPGWEEDEEKEPAKTEPEAEEVEPQVEAEETVLQAADTSEPSAAVAAERDEEEAEAEEDATGTFAHFAELLQQQVAPAQGAADEAVARTLAALDKAAQADTAADPAAAGVPSPALGDLLAQTPGPHTLRSGLCLLASLATRWADGPLLAEVESIGARVLAAPGAAEALVRSDAGCCLGALRLDGALEGGKGAAYTTAATRVLPAAAAQQLAAVWGTKGEEALLRSLAAAAGGCCGAGRGEWVSEGVCRLLAGMLGDEWADAAADGTVESVLEGLRSCLAASDEVGVARVLGGEGTEVVAGLAQAAWDSGGPRVALCCAVLHHAASQPDAVEHLQTQRVLDLCRTAFSSDEDDSAAAAAAAVAPDVGALLLPVLLRLLIDAQDDGAPPLGPHSPYVALVVRELAAQSAAGGARLRAHLDAVALAENLGLLSAALEAATDAGDGADAATGDGVPLDAQAVAVACGVLQAAADSDDAAVSARAAAALLNASGGLLARAVAAAPAAQASALLRAALQHRRPSVPALLRRLVADAPGFAALLAAVDDGRELGRVLAAFLRAEEEEVVAVVASSEVPAVEDVLSPSAGYAAAGVAAQLTADVVAAAASADLPREVAGGAAADAASAAAFLYRLLGVVCAAATAGQAAEDACCLTHCLRALLMCCPENLELLCAACEGPAGSAQSLLGRVLEVADRECSDSVVQALLGVVAAAAPRLCGEGDEGIVRAFMALAARLLGAPASSSNDRLLEYAADACLSSERFAVRIGLPAVEAGSDEDSPDEQSSDDLPARPSVLSLLFSRGVTRQHVLFTQAVVAKYPHLRAGAVGEQHLASLAKLVAGSCGSNADEYAAMFAAFVSVAGPSGEALDAAVAVLGAQLVRRVADGGDAGDAAGEGGEGQSASAQLLACLVAVGPRDACIDSVARAAEAALEAAVPSLAAVCAVLAPLRAWAEADAARAAEIRETLDACGALLPPLRMAVEATAEKPGTSPPEVFAEYLLLLAAFYEQGAAPRTADAAALGALLQTSDASASGVVRALGYSLSLFVAKRVLGDGDADASLVPVAESTRGLASVAAAAESAPSPLSERQRRLCAAASKLLGSSAAAAASTDATADDALRDALRAALARGTRAEAAGELLGLQVEALEAAAARRRADEAAAAVGRAGAARAAAEALAAEAAERTLAARAVADRVAAAEGAAAAEAEARSVAEAGVAKLREAVAEAERLLLEERQRCETVVHKMAEAHQRREEEEEVAAAEGTVRARSAGADSDRLDGVFEARVKELAAENSRLAQEVEDLTLRSPSDAGTALATDGDRRRTDARWERRLAEAVAAEARKHELAHHEAALLRGARSAALEARQTLEAEETAARGDAALACRTARRALEEEAAAALCRLRAAEAAVAASSLGKREEAARVRLRRAVLRVDGEWSEGAAMGAQDADAGAGGAAGAAAAAMEQEARAAVEAEQREAAEGLGARQKAALVTALCEGREAVERAIRARYEHESETAQDAWRIYAEKVSEDAEQRVREFRDVARKMTAANDCLEQRLAETRRRGSERSAEMALALTSERARAGRLRMRARTLSLASKGTPPTTPHDGGTSGQAAAAVAALQQAEAYGRSLIGQLHTASAGYLSVLLAEERDEEEKADESAGTATASLWPTGAAFYRQAGRQGVAVSFASFRHVLGRHYKEAHGAAAAATAPSPDEEESGETTYVEKLRVLFHELKDGELESDRALAELQIRADAASGVVLVEDETHTATPAVAAPARRCDETCARARAVQQVLDDLVVAHEAELGAVRRDLAAERSAREDVLMRAGRSEDLADAKQQLGSLQALHKAAAEERSREAAENKVMRSQLQRAAESAATQARRIDSHAVERNQILQLLEGAKAELQQRDSREAAAAAAAAAPGGANGDGRGGDAASLVQQNRELREEAVRLQNERDQLQKRCARAGQALERHAADEEQLRAKGTEAAIAAWRVARLECDETHEAFLSMKDREAALRRALDGSQKELEIAMERDEASMAKYLKLLSMQRSIRQHEASLHATAAWREQGGGASDVDAALQDPQSRTANKKLTPLPATSVSGASWASPKLQTDPYELNPPLSLVMAGRNQQASPTADVASSQLRSRHMHGMNRTA